MQPSDFHPLLLFHLSTKDTARGNQYVQGATELESSFAENGLGILVDIVSQQCALPEEGKWCLWLRQTKYCQQVKGGHNLFSAAEATPRMTSQYKRHMIY